jgi:hypothetical protein
MSLLPALRKEAHHLHSLFQNFRNLFAKKRKILRRFAQKMRTFSHPSAFTLTPYSADPYENSRRPAKIHIPTSTPQNPANTH